MFIWIIVVVLTWLPIIFCLYMWRREYIIRKYSTSEIVGRVSSHKEWDSLRPPIVEYEVDGNRYTKLLEYELVTYRPSDISYPQDLESLRSFMIRHKRLHNINLMPYNMYQIYPVGYKMIVKYNPKKPKLAYVERYAGGESLYRAISILLIIITLPVDSIILWVAS